MRLANAALVLPAEAVWCSAAWWRWSVSECRNFIKIISQAAYVGFHLILGQDTKDFWAGTSVDGWTLHWKLDLFVWFLWWLRKNEVLKNLPQSVQGSFSRLLDLPSSKCLVMFKFNQLYMATTCTGIFFLFLEHFLQKHIENHLSQLKNLWDPG